MSATCVCLQDKTHNFLVDLRNTMAFSRHVWVVTLCDQLKTSGPYRGHPRNLVFNMFNSEFFPEVCDLLKRKGSSSQPSILSNVKLHTGGWWKNPAPLVISMKRCEKKGIFSASTGALSSFRHDFNLLLLLLLLSPDPSARCTTPFPFPPKKGKAGTLNAGSTNLFINAEPLGIFATKKSNNVT